MGFFYDFYLNCTYTCTYFYETIHYKNKIVINKNLLYSTMNYIQYLVINYNGKESKKYIDIYLNICITYSLCWTFKTNTILQINYTSIKKKEKGK